MIQISNNQTAMRVQFQTKAKRIQKTKIMKKAIEESKAATKDSSRIQN